MRRMGWLGCVGLAVVAFALAVRSDWLGQQLALRKVRKAIFTGDATKLVEQMESLRLRNPGSAELTFLSAVACRRSGKTPQASEFLDQAWSLGWSRKAIQRERAMLRFQAGETKETERFLLGLPFDASSDTDPIEVYECLAKGYMSAMRLREAVFCINSWVGAAPDALEPRLLRAEIYNLMREHVREEAEYRDILRIDPTSFSAHVRLGNLLLRNKQIREALAEFETCRRLLPQEVKTLIRLASCHLHLGELDAAETALKQAEEMKQSPSVRALALTELGRLALDRKDFAKAAADLQEAVDLSPRNPTAHYALGTALSRLGDSKQAKLHLDLSHEIESAVDRYGDLVHEIMRVPQDPEPRCKAGEILLDQGLHKKAYVWFLSALNCDERSSRAHRCLGRYYADIGQQDLSERHRAMADRRDEALASEVAGKR